MSGIIRRLIARARAPLSPVRPLLPSRFEADRDRSGHDFERTALAVGSQATVPFEHDPGGGEPESTDAMTTPETAGTRRDPATAFRPATVAPARSAQIIASVEAGVAQDSGRARTIASGGEADRTRASVPATRDTEAPAWPRIPPASDAAPLPRGDVAPAGSSRAAIRSAHKRDRGDGQDAAGRGVGATSAEYAADRRDTAQAVAVDSRGAPARLKRDLARGAAADEVAQAGTTEVMISIGHIEVRASPPEPPRKPAARPRVTLDEFLRRGETAGR